MDPRLPGLRVLRPSAPTACNTIRGGLTDREVALLLQMKALKEALRGAPPAEWPALIRSLEALKAHRQEARRERMARLGHLPEEPEPAESSPHAPPALNPLIP